MAFDLVGSIYVTNDSKQKASGGWEVKSGTPDSPVAASMLNALSAKSSRFSYVSTEERDVWRRFVAVNSMAFEAWVFRLSSKW